MSKENHWFDKLAEGFACARPVSPNIWPAYQRKRTPYFRHLWNAIRGRGR